MSQNTNNLSAMNKIESHLPGHQNQDKNMNGIPDRMEGRNQDLNRDGIPDRLQGGQQMGINGQQQMGGQQMGINGQQMGINGQQMNQQGQGFGFIGSTTTNTQSVVDVREAPVVVQTIEKPTIVHEVIKTEQITQVQPIIERQREKLDVYEVVQPMREREVIATEVRTATLAAQTRATIVEDSSAFQAQRSAPGEFSTREVAATMSQTVQNAPIIHETITHRVIEEVQPVIYKEIVRPILIKETLPIYEKIVEAPHAHHTVLPMQDMGTRTVTSTTTTTGFTDYNRDGIPDQLQMGGAQYTTTGLTSGIQSQGIIGQQGQFQQQGLQGQQFQQQGLQGQQYVQGQQYAPGQQGMIGQQGLQGQQYVQGQQGMVGQQGQFQQQGQQGQRSIHDLNGNGIPDRMEQGHGLKDLNGNGINDSLERKMGSTSLNSNRL